MSLGQVAEIITMVVLGRVLIRLGWKWTMIIGIMGHAARFAVFAFFPDMKGLIIAVQLLHGICYAFFFASVYIFVDAVFPKDVRASAQGLFNLLILGAGMVVASFYFPSLVSKLTTEQPNSAGEIVKVVDYQTLFLYPTAFAIFGILMLVLFFKPPTRGPEDAVIEIAPLEKAPGEEEGGVPSPV
jgi:MFS family permease